MSAFRVVLPVALSFALGACSIHPLPEDVTGLKTAQIVHRIRCEAAKAVEDAANNIQQETPIPALTAVCARKTVRM